MDQEGPVADLPQRHAPPEAGNELRLGVRQPEEASGRLDLPVGLRVEDAGLGVGQEPFSHPDLLGPGGADRGEVREPMEDGDVGHAEGPGQLPRRLQPPRHTEVGQDGPGLVHHHDHVARAPAGPVGEAGVQPGRGAGHEHAEGGGTIDRREVEDHEGAPERDAGGRLAVEHPAQVAADQSPQLERHLATVGRHLPGLRPNRARRGRARLQQRLDDTGERRRAGLVAAGRHGVDGQVEGAALTREERAPEAGRGQRGQKLAPRSGHLLGVHPDGRVEGVQPDPTTGTERDRLAAPGAGQWPVLALGVDHPCPAAEHGLSPQVGLHERALAPADLAEHDHVGVGDRSGPVQLERVVREGATQQVPSHQHAAAAEAGLGGKRVGGPEMASGGLVGGERHGGIVRRRRQASPRPRGSVHAKARAWSP